MKVIKFLFILFCGYTCWSQDVHFSQYYQSPLYLNPGFTGAAEYQRLIANHRLQWPGLPDAFSTYAFSYDAYLQQLRSGLGISFTSDKLGSAGWTTTAANILYAYKIKLSRDLVFSPGLSFGYGTNGIDRSKVELGDQLQYGGQSLDPILNQLTTQHYFDFGSGFIVYSKQIWMGASLSHLNRPNISVLKDESRLPIKTTIHGGIKLPLTSMLSQKPIYLTPSFIYRTQGRSFSQFNLGTNFHVDPISIGLWYSGTPFKHATENIMDQDAVVLFIGLYLKKLTIGYSHDFTISSLNGNADGAHELSITYAFSTRRNQRTKNKYKLIPCPSFMDKGGFQNY